MKIKKAFLSVLLLFTLSIAAFAQIKIGLLRGMTSIPFANLYEDEKYDFAFFDRPEELFSRMQQGQIDATIVSSLIAEELVKKTDHAVTVCAVVSKSDFYIAGRQRGKVNFSSLVGHTLYVPGKGLSYKMLFYLLKKNHIPVEDGPGGINVVLMENQEKTLSAFLKDEDSYALLSGPALFEALKRSHKIKINLDLQEQFQILEGNGKILPNSVLLVRSQLVRERMGLLQILKKDLETSVDQIVKRPKYTAKVAVKNNFGLSEKNCAGAISLSSFDFIPVNEEFHLIVNQ